ncbi:hypothetical protein NEUTE1DRAFT_100952 [Neurospora tetrasperma FGSC 2508]|uniref:Uncharacterized protein n=1 Tax=Neurospora tetrasperma (strain FGSC 2508 / ATCC MYA-4615 / P0657) TaxID=510951 RepID=F8MNA8_NEUT8|nr:uncharacterized protein NEUTE1DRAFT_100952 [Neurospora tetrasperma FGSC 2508]EGO58078.1 hypothetical protein NEUTE1DRAFT_100952 [Neurospora tetrasperma FGSC 2508]EGZ71614.1 hypothetical protein NEUTE2DRAFT_129005 [Neurospora tetrasperma FGSC 2509]
MLGYVRTWSPVTNRPVSGMQLELKTADVQDVDNDARKNRVAPPSVSRELVGGILAMKNTPHSYSHLSLLINSAVIIDRITMMLEVITTH